MKKFLSSFGFVALALLGYWRWQQHSHAATGTATATMEAEPVGDDDTPEAAESISTTTSTTPQAARVDAGAMTPVRRRLRQGEELPEWMHDPRNARADLRSSGPRPSYEREADALQQLRESRSDEITSAEDGMLDLYGRIAMAIYANPGNCGAVADTIQQEILERADVPAALASEREALGDDTARVEAQVLFEQQAGDELNALRQAFRRGIAACHEEPRVFDSIRELAAVGRTK